MIDSELSIYLAHGDSARRKVILANLEMLSHEIRLSTDSPAVLMRRCEENPPDVAVVGSGFLEDDCFDVLNKISEINKCPVVAILRQSDMDRSHRLMEDQVMGVLVEPVSDMDLRTAIYLARRRFEQSKNMQRRIDELRFELNDIDDHNDGLKD